MHSVYYSLLIALATFVNEGGNDGGGSNFGRLAGVDDGLLLFSDTPRSVGIDLRL